MSRQKTSLPGVSYKAHKTRIHDGKKDQYFFIHYADRSGKNRIAAVGWASEGWTVTKASWILRALKQNMRTGNGPQSLEEWREIETLVASVVTWDWYQPYWQEIKRLPIEERD